MAQSSHQRDMSGADDSENDITGHTDDGMVPTLDWADDKEWCIIIIRPYGLCKFCKVFVFGSKYDYAKITANGLE